MANLAQKVVQRSKFPAISLDDYVSFFGFGGLNYPFGFTQTLSGTKEEIADYSFEGLVLAGYKTNGVVFACMLARQLLFSEARFQYRQRLNGRPGDLFGTKDLQILERPWPGGVTADLLSRAIQDVDLSGNFFATRRPNRIRRMRPDWVTIILGSFDDPTIQAGDLDAEVVGYMYHPGGRLSARPPVMLLREQVAHFAPIPDPTASYRGMSWLIPVIREFISDTAMITHKQKFFENGATPNMVVTLDPSIKKEAFKEWVQMFSDKHEGALNAYKTLYLGAGSTVMPVGKDFRQMDFAITQAAGETRIAAAAGVPPVIVGLSEGLKAATYSNYSQARRRFADMTMRPLWRSMATSLEILVPPQPNAELWYDDRDIPALIEDFKDRAEVQARNAQAIRQLVDAGFEPDAVVDAITADDLKRLQGKHTGLFSVQLQPPQPDAPKPDGSPGTPDDPAHPGQLDSTGPSASKTGAGDAPAAPPAAEKKSAVELLMEIAELRHLVQGPPQLPARSGDVNVHLHEGMVRNEQPITIEAPTTIAEGAVRVRTPDIHVEAPTTIAEGAVRVEAPTTIAEGAVRVRTPDVHVEAPTTIQEGAVRVEAPTTFAEGSIRAGDVTVEPADVEVRIEPGAVQVDAPTTIEAGAVQVDVAPPELRMEAGAIQVDAPTTIEAGAVQVESPVTVERTEVHVDPGAVQVSSPVTVERTEVHVDEGAVQVDAPVTVERTEVHIDEGAVRVDAPVTVERTEVHLDPGSVTVPVTVERTEVHIDPGAVRVDAPVTIEEGAFRADAPQITVETPEVRIEAPITVESPVTRFEEGAIRVEAPTTIAEGAVRLDAPITMERGAVEVQIDSPVQISDGAVRVDSPVTIEPGAVEVNSTFEAAKIPEKKKRGATLRDTTFKHDKDGKIIGKREVETDDEGQRMVRDTEFITDDDGKIVGKREVEGETDD